MEVKMEQKEKKDSNLRPNKVQPGRTRKKLPWLDGKSSITSSPLYSLPGHASTAMHQRSISPPSRQLTPASIEIASKLIKAPSTTSKWPKMLESRRQSVARSASTSVGQPKTKRRLSVVHIDDTDALTEARLGANSLATVLDHLERVETPDSILRPFRPAVEEFSNQPDLVPRLPERHSHHRLNDAIQGLEDLVQDAVTTAERTEQTEHVGQIFAIIKDASSAILDASTHPSQQHTRSSSRSQVSAQETYLHNDKRRELVSTDWAYAKDQNHHHCRPRSPSLSSASCNSLRSPNNRCSRFSSGSDLLQLLPPQPIATVTRDHVDHVLRPMISRSLSRGRSRRRRASRDYCRQRHRNHHSRRSDGARSRSLHRGPPHDNHFDLETSSSEEDVHPAINENGVRGYGDELHVRETNHHTFSLLRNHRRQPIARNWRAGKKRICAFIACVNTAVLGIIIGIYAGEVPRIQYVLADENHHVIVGNVILYFGLALSTFVCWPLPLLHGRKPYILASLTLAMPLQFPQALVISQNHSPDEHRFLAGLLIARGVTGVILGFANVNFISTLLDLFGASLQSRHPHQEFTTATDVRRHGGGMGMWLGLWSWCWIGSLAGGFQVGAGIIDSLTPDWGFYITIMILAGVLIINIMAPETRRSAYRRSVTEVYDRDENFITRRVARGEIKLHISTEGPKYWFEEVWAGLKLSTMMLCQPGFLVLSLYLGWIYAQIVLVIVLLGALLSREYKWHSQMVGLGVMSIAIGALLAIPLTKAGIFSRERKNAFRTDSMTFQKQVSWSSHLIRRCIFTLVLPLMGLAYTVSSASRPKPYMVPIVFAGAVGFMSVLAIAECHGLIMETFDTSDLQPGVNTRHRLQSMAVQDRRRRTNFSSFPRVSAGIFTSQALAFVGAAVATEVGGIMTRHIGAQASTGVTAGILLFLTLLLTLVLWRFKQVQVIPNYTFGTRRDTVAWQEFKELEKEGRGGDWKAVVIGNPSGKMRRMSVLELGRLSRWTEIRKLNFLIRAEERERKRDDWHQGGSW